jgi:hypothetical protein
MNAPTWQFPTAGMVADRDDEDGVISKLWPISGRAVLVAELPYFVTFRPRLWLGCVSRETITTPNRYKPIVSALRSPAISTIRRVPIQG